MKYNNKLTILSLILIIIVTIGYALVNTSLSINTKTSIGNLNYDIIYDNLVVLSGENLEEIDEENNIKIGTAKIEDDKKNVSFSLNMNDIGDEYSFSVDIVNNGNLPVKISKEPTLSGLNDAQLNIVDFKMFYTSSNEDLKVGDYLLVGERKNVTVNLKYYISKDITQKEYETIKDGSLLNSKIDIGYEVVSFEEISSR